MSAEPASTSSGPLVDAFGDLTPAKYLEHLSSKTSPSHMS